MQCQSGTQPAEFLALHARPLPRQSVAVARQSGLYVGNNKNDVGFATSGESHDSIDDVSPRRWRELCFDLRRCGACANVTIASARCRTPCTEIRTDCDDHDARLSRSWARRFQTSHREFAWWQEAASAAGN